MKPNKIATTLNLPSALVQKATQVYDTTNISKAINLALMDAFFLPCAFTNLTPYALHQITDIAERTNFQRVSIRLPEEVLRILDGLTPEANLQDTVSMVLAQILYTPLKEVDFTNYSHLLSVLGSKWDERMQNAILKIEHSCKKRWKNSVETCAGALGIHANVSFSDTRIINDDDWNKINLYRTIQAYPCELLLHMKNFETSSKTFERLKNLEYVSSKKINIEAAARYLFLNLTSYRREGSTFLNTMTDDNFQKKLTAIYPTHKRLEDTEILELDLFKVIKKYRKNSSTIFIVDPPYLGTNVYKNRRISNETTHGKNFDLAEHKKLANMLRLVKENNGNDFIYFCRITVTRKKNKENQIISTDKDLKLGDKDLLGTIDDLYYGHGFYYMDVELDKGTVERIITSFPFDDAISYK